ncbi:exocyst complex protein [Pholiota molesta]|nr:exocyst complex protein [Pholiota molesta]
MTPRTSRAFCVQGKLVFLFGKFDVTEFVGHVSEKLIAESKADNGPFDPKPFIRSFEAAVDKLIAVRKDVQAKTEQMEKTVRVAEREYSKKMAELTKGRGNSFSGMESRMNEVSSTAIRIGDTSRLDALRKEGRAGRRQVAVVLRRLNTVAKEVDLPNSDKTRENIEKYCEKFEKEMLNLFDRCYRKGDPKLMHHCAQTLLEFNGGASCIQVYVNQHDFFINNVREAPAPVDTVLWRTIGDPNVSPPKTEAGLTDLFAEIRSTVDTEAQIVKAVFPNPPVVMQVFLQRVFAQSIQQHMEQLLHKGSDISDLAYLRVLQLVHIQASALVEDLKAHELPQMVSRTPYEATEFRRSLAGSAPVTGSAPSAAISTMLETAMEELFVPYTEGQRYMERETKSLTALYGGLLANFARYHNTEGKSSMFDRMVNQISAATNTTTAGGASTTSAQAAAALMRFGSPEEPIREEDGVLSVDVAEKMLKWHAEAIGRCVELSPPNDVPKNTSTLLRVLAEAIGTSYVDIALETAQVRLEAVDTKTEPNMHPLTIVKCIDLICHLWQQYVNIALLLSQMVMFNNQTVNRMETGANTLLQRITDAIINWLTLQLTKQKRNDFKPRNDDLSFARVNTEPCVACCETLEKVRDAAKQNLSGKNLEVFLTEIGIAFHSLLLDHLRKFPVSATGGLMLAKHNQQFWHSCSARTFRVIRQLGNVFLVRPEILKSYITEGYLGRIDSSLLKPYLSLRSDWGHLKRTQGPGLRDRFARLSVMMKDLEGLKVDGIQWELWQCQLSHLV